MVPFAPHPHRSAELTTKPSPSEGGGKDGADVVRDFSATFRSTNGKNRACKLEVSLLICE
jgi:hypothetical protein